MKQSISEERILNIIIALLTIVLAFHTLVLSGVIPYAIVWAGKISTAGEMRKLEMVSILVIAFAILILILKADYLKHKIPAKILRAIIFVFAVLFSLNTIGNLFSESRFELYFFTPITFILAVLCFRLLWMPKIS